MSKGKKKISKSNKPNPGDRHLTLLLALLTDFYEFLGSTPQPSDEQVRASFIAHDLKWRQHCTKNQLTPAASLLFNKQVSAEWNKRMQREATTENETLK